MHTTTTKPLTLTLFIEALSDEFTEKTGFGVYAYLAPTELTQVYQELQQRQQPIRKFVSEYVREHL